MVLINMKMAVGSNVIGRRIGRPNGICVHSPEEIKAKQIGPESGCR